MIIKYVILCIFISIAVYIHLKERETRRIKLANSSEEEIDLWEGEYEYANRNLRHHLKYEDLPHFAKEYVDWRNSLRISSDYDCAVIAATIYIFIYLFYIFYNNQLVNAGSFVIDLCLILVFISTIGGLAGAMVSSFIVERFVYSLESKNIKYWTICIICSIFAAVISCAIFTPPFLGLYYPHFYD